MTVRVIAWPPVGVTGAEWTIDAPVESSRSLITGRAYTSAAQRRRRMAALTVSARAMGGMGAGYMEMLKRHLDGGVAKVRLYSHSINRFLDHGGEAPSRRSARVLWSSGGEAISWTSGGAALAWFTGKLLVGATGTAGGWPIITVSGLPPSRVIARPGEFVTAYRDADDDVGATSQITAVARSDAAGVAVLRLFDPLPGDAGARVNIGTSDTAVFDPVVIPRSVQPARGDWTYSWQFREVFPDEVGGFMEVDPWS